MPPHGGGMEVYYGLQKTAVDILAAIGGSDNIVSAAHCVTRLRLVIADNSKVSKSVLETVNIGDSLLKLV